MQDFLIVNKEKTLLNEKPFIELVYPHEKNAHIKLLQSLLNTVGNNLIEDGIYGNKTYTSVRAFQKKYGLIEDGIVGVRTWGTLINLKK